MSTEISNVNVYEFFDLMKSDQYKVIDVRTPAEYKEARIADCPMIDFNSPDFANQIALLDKEQSYLVYCRSGNRSMRAIQVMSQLGFKKLVNMDGGILAWSQNGLPLIR